MAVILVHIGDALPEYIRDCIEQLRTWGNENIYLATDAATVSDLIELDISEIISLEKFKSENKIVQYEQAAFFKLGTLWDVSCKRLFYLECVMRYLKLKQAWHIENDNMVYCNLGEVAKYFGHHSKQILISPITDTLCSAGIMLINDIETLSKMNDEILKLMALGQSGFREVHGDEFISEMRFLNVLAEKIMPDDIYYFQTVNDKGSYNIYDPASWGQLLDGIPIAPGIPHISPAHIVAKYLMTLPEHERKIRMHEEAEYGWYPTFRGDKIMNLHIHSKRLNRWRSI
jgi:hypothetical protein